MSDHNQGISVIIPTYNGADRILNTLTVLEQQSYRDFELIVVIDGSTDNTKSILEKKSLNFKSLRIIEQKNKGRAAVRNTGVKEAKGNILIFYDDDMRPTSYSIQQHLDFHNNFLNSICVGNPVEDKRLLKTDIQKYKAHLSVKWTQKFHDGLNRIDKQSLFLTAANLSINKDLFIKIGGFDERLTDAEDYEFAIRATQLDVPIYFDKENIAWHDDFITCSSYIKRQRQYNNVNKLLKKIIPASFPLEEIKLDRTTWFRRSVYSFFGDQ